MQRKVQVRRVREHMNGADLPQGKHDQPTGTYTLPEPCAVNVCAMVRIE